MKPILEAREPIGYIDTLYPTTTHVSFDFQASSNAFGAFFKARDGAFALTITANNVYIVNEKQVTYINKPIELQVGKWYHAECGIKTDRILEVYVLYVRIWQETARVRTPRKQSKRRMLVAQKRLQRYKDVLRPSRLPERDVHRILKQLPYCRDTTGIGWDKVNSAYTLTLTGNLRGNYCLAKPFTVFIEWCTDYWLITEPTHFNHTTHKTIAKAVAHFRRCLIDDFEFLAKYDGMMSRWLQNELAYLREMIKDSDEEPTYCAVCHMSADVHCERCDDDLCAVCAKEDEGIIFCYECWLEREKELEREEQA